MNARATVSKSGRAGRRISSAAMPGCAADATGTVRVAAAMSVTSVEMSVGMDSDGGKSCGLSTVIDGLGTTRAKGRFLASVSDRKFEAKNASKRC